MSVHHTSEAPLCMGCIGRLVARDDWVVGLAIDYPREDSILRWRPSSSWPSNPSSSSQCSMCKRILIKCLHCMQFFFEDEGHACPEILVPRRREAVLETRRRQNLA